MKLILCKRMKKKRSKLIIKFQLNRFKNESRSLSKDRTLLHNSMSPILHLHLTINKKVILARKLRKKVKIRKIKYKLYLQMFLLIHNLNNKIKHKIIIILLVKLLLKFKINNQTKLKYCKNKRKKNRYSKFQKHDKLNKKA